MSGSHKIWHSCGCCHWSRVTIHCRLHEHHHATSVLCIWCSYRCSNGLQVKMGIQVLCIYINLGISSSIRSSSLTIFANLKPILLDSWNMPSDESMSMSLWTSDSSNVALCLLQGNTNFELSRVFECNAFRYVLTNMLVSVDEMHHKLEQRGIDICEVWHYE